MEERSLLGVFMAIHRFTVAAFHRAGDPMCYPEQLADTLEAFTPQKLYAMAFPRSIMRKMRSELEEQGQDIPPGGDQATIPLEEMGTSDDRITTVVTLTQRQIETKLQASVAHRTQMAPQFAVEAQRPQAYLEWISAENFVLLYPPGAAPHSEGDLFDGVDV